MTVTRERTEVGMSCGPTSAGAGGARPGPGSPASPDAIEPSRRRPVEGAGRRRRERAAAPRGRLLLALFVALAVAPAVTTAAPAPPSAPPAASPSPANAPPTAPTSIPVPEVARRAEEVGRLLRDSDALAVPGPAVEAIEKRLPGIADRIAAQAEVTNRQLEEHPAEPTLALTALWNATRVELGVYIDVLTKKATELEEALNRLTAVRETWKQTRVETRASRAPAQVIVRIDSVVTALDASTARLQKQRAATLVLQDSLAQQMARCETVQARIAGTRQGLAGRLFLQDGQPVWHVEELARGFAELPERVRDAVAADVAQLRQFVRDQRSRIPLHLAVFVALALLMGAARRRMYEWEAQGDLAAGVRVFDRPVAAALVLTLVASGIDSSAPRGALALGKVLALGPALRVMRVLVDPPLVPGLYVLGGFFLADLVRSYASVVPLLEQQIFLLEMLGGMAVLAWWLVARRPRHGPTTPAPTARERALRIAAGLLLTAFGVALVAGAAGYMSLALLLGAGILGSGYVGLVLYAGVRVGDALVVFMLRVRPFRLLGMVARRRPLLERRAHDLLRWLAIGGWLMFALRYFGLWSAAMAFARGALQAEVRLGAVSISLGDVLAFALTVWAAFILSALVRFVLAEDVYPHLRLGQGLPYVLSRLLHYGLLLGGFLLALAALGVDLTKLTILAGAFGVGIGFGLQNVVNNFVSGLVVLFERRLDVGDVVQIGDLSGRMQQMGIRACIVRTWEGAEVIVPNASLISDKVTNWTLSDRLRRIDVAVGVAYGTTPQKVLDLLLGVAQAHPQVLRDPAPVALFQGFGESALRFQMLVWTDRFDLWPQIQSELAMAVYAALREAGVEIPFPQRDVRVRQG